MRSDRRRPVTIVGGGFSGTMVAAQLARRGIASTLVEGGGRRGLGTAFSTTEPAHVLNVPAASMSAWPDDPSHFARFFERSGGSSDGFAQRRLFGRYLREILDEAVAGGCVALVDEAAVAARPNGQSWVVELSNGSQIESDAVVLAIGNQPPQPFQQAGTAGGRFLANPWGDEAKAAIEAAAAEDSDVAILGTGLTMVDMVLSLDSAGHRGRIVAVSRRGLVPRAHAPSAPAPVEREDVPLGSVRALWRWVRSRADRSGWRAAIDALRPHSHGIWQSLTHADKQRFLRHARPWWDVHRHRIAPEVGERIRELIGEGRLEVIAGRIAAIDPAPDSIELRVATRGGRGEVAIRAAFAFNCTGPLGSIARTRDPLLKQVIGEGIACPDSLGIGLEVDERSRVTGARRAWALGPLTKGRYWEIIAVPDIREQAADVAEDIAMELER